MSLANGREYLAIPGPSVMPDRVLRAMHRAAPNIYEGAIVDEVAGIAADLPGVVGVRHEVVEAMEPGRVKRQVRLLAGNVLEEKCDAPTDGASLSEDQLVTTLFGGNKV